MRLPTTSLLACKGLNRCAGRAAVGSFARWERFNPTKHQTGTALDICDKTL